MLPLLLLKATAQVSKERIVTKRLLVTQKKQSHAGSRSPKISHAF
jgi:hypothetical protein